MSAQILTFLHKICAKLINLQMLLTENSATAVAKYTIARTIGKKEPVKIRISGHDMHVRPATPDLNVARSSLGKEYRSLDTAYPKNMPGLIIDAGGYIGTAALVFAKMYPEATIVTVEPSSENFRLLEQNIRGWKNIHALNAALTAERSDEKIMLGDRGTGQWGFTIVAAPEDCKISEKEFVSAVTIDSILEQFGFDEISILKMDIEGAEYEFFKQTGWLAKTNILAIELHERIVSGCEKAFFTANENRFIYKDGGEKYISVGQNIFNR